MYHPDLGKSTLDLWGEELERKQRLGDVATVLRRLEEKRAAELQSEIKGVET